ncbi:melanocyte-stimulating hormone receptor [Nematostella vectensis]|uniref:melanocyte-stimulating hormone receptor n=1 Tax=Nematostella vectensis TaxID=45351 RepID=UPI0020777841|nr:melanocyte-stimulating hormone receptor [Nematostella vectensis]
MVVFTESCLPFSEWLQCGQISYTEFIGITLINGLTFVPAILLNALVLAAIWKTSTLHTPAMILLSNLALSDLCVGLLAQPLLFSSITLELNAYHLPDIYCTVSIAFGVISSFVGVVSLVSITAVAVDRFLAIYLHLRYPSVVTMKRAFVVCVAFWVFSSLLSVVWIVLGMDTYNVSFCVVMGICKCAIFTSYIQVYGVIKKHKLQIRAMAPTVSTELEIITSPRNIKRYAKSVTSSLYVYFAFVVCYAPCFCAFAYFGITADNCHSPSFIKVSMTLMFANSAINPVIYYWRMTELRVAVRRTMLRSGRATDLSGTGNGRCRREAEHEVN